MLRRIALEASEGQQEAQRALVLAQEFLDELAGSHGEPARLRLTAAEPLRWLDPDGESPISGTEVHARPVSGRIHLDIYDAGRDVTIASAAVSNEGDAEVALGALRQRLGSAGVDPRTVADLPYAHQGKPRAG